MKVEIHRYCTGESIVIDGQDFSEISFERHDTIINLILEKLKIKISEGNIDLKDVIGCFQYDDYKDLGTCEQCFDSSYTLTYNL